MLRHGIGELKQSTTTSEKLRFIEFFAGIGGFAACCDSHEIVAAIDIDQMAKRVYEANFAHRYFTLSLESVKASWLDSLQANAWWLSPPCQPFSRRGNQKDRSDSRSLGLENLLRMIPALRPRWILLENVIGFGRSEMHRQFCAILKDAGYVWQSLEVCPSEWGWPNRRPRFYLMATTGQLVPWQEPPKLRKNWRELIDHPFPIELVVDNAFIQKFQCSLDRMTLGGEDKPTACFGSSYGVASSGAGSYVEYEPGRFRRFSPREVLRLLGFPETFRIDPAIPLKKQWKLVGNSLSLPVIRYILQHLS